MSIELKIKTKHLSAEAAIIRREENKLKKSLAWAKANEKAEEEAKLRGQIHSLHHHRTTTVRSHARSAHLAHSYMRGRTYRQIENDKTRTQPNWKAIARMIFKYSTEDERVCKQQFAAWKDQAFS